MYSKPRIRRGPYGKHIWDKSEVVGRHRRKRDGMFYMPLQHPPIHQTGKGDDIAAFSFIAIIFIGIAAIGWAARSIFQCS